MLQDAITEAPLFAEIGYKDVLTSQRNPQNRPCCGLWVDFSGVGDRVPGVAAVADELSRNRLEDYSVANSKIKGEKCYTNYELKSHLIAYICM